MPQPRRNRFRDVELNAGERLRKVTKLAARGRRKSGVIEFGDNTNTSSSGTVRAANAATRATPAKSKGSFIDRIRSSIASGLRSAAAKRRNRRR